MAQQSMSLGDLTVLLMAIGEPVSWKPAIKGIKLLLIAGVKENFDKESDPDGVPWKPLKRPRRRKRDLVRGTKRGRKKKGIDKILQDTGLLRTSMVSSQTATINKADKLGLLKNAFVDDNPAAFEQTDTSVEYGTPVIYGIYHQKGVPKNNLPARPFLGISDETGRDIEELVGDFIQEAILERLGG
jgi:phage gpG-like protein